MVTILIFVKAKRNSPIPPITSADYFPEKYNHVYYTFGMDGRQDLIWAFFRVSDLVCPSQQWTIFLPSMQKQISYEATRLALWKLSAHQSDSHYKVKIFWMHLF